MSQADELEAALAEVERTYEEQNATFRALASRIEELGSASVHVDERELAELTSFTELNTPAIIQPFVLGARC